MPFAERLKHRSLLRKPLRFYSGPLIFLIWLPAVVSGFWFEFGAESRVTEGWSNAPDQVMQLEQWFRSQQTRETSGLLTVVRVPLAADRSCSCLAGQATAFEQLRVRWPHEAVRFVAPKAVPALPSGVDVLIFGADGHLRFAGPGLSSGTCGAAGLMLDKAIQAISHFPANGTTGARLLRGACQCAIPVLNGVSTEFGIT